jgi:hypothetical protein
MAICGGAESRINPMGMMRQGLLKRLNESCNDSPAGAVRPFDADSKGTVFGEGGGLFILDNPFSDHPTVRNVLENSVCENGRFKGQKITGDGGFMYAMPELATAVLHGIAVGNMIPSSVLTVCVDIDPAVATKLADCGSSQALAAVTDVGAFLETAAPDAFRSAYRRVGADHLLVTLGADGIALVGRDETVRIPGVRRAVYDVSGAGDTVTAWVGLALAAGASMEEAAMVANVAAGLEVGKAGVATVTADELLAACDAG